MTDPISPDSPEFRLLCQLAGLKPSAFAAALNNPEHFSKHITADELSRYYLGGVKRICGLILRIQAILDAELDRTLTTKPELAKKLKSRGLL